MEQTYEVNTIRQTNTSKTEYYITNSDGYDTAMNFFH